MIKKLGLTTLALSALLLSGCGGSKGNKGSKSTTDKIKENDVILIFRDVYNGRCQEKADEIIKEFEEDKDYHIKNVTVTTINEDTTCATYGRSNDFNTCIQISLAQGTETCVISYDEIKENKNLKQVGLENLNDIEEIISSELL